MRPPTPGDVEQLAHVAADLDGAPLYVTDDAGQRWRVLDVRFGPPHNAPYQWSWHEPPDPAASSRVFVGERLGIGGLREARPYRWKEGEDRADLSEATLLRQLHASEWWDRRPIAEITPSYAPTPSTGSATAP